MKKMGNGCLDKVTNIRPLFGTAAVLLITVSNQALAQSIYDIPSSSVQLSLDNYGVDLATGALNLSITDASIGAATSGLTHKRYWLGSNAWRDQFDSTLTLKAGKVTIANGGDSRTFTTSGATYAPDQGDGSSLSFSGSSYTYTARDGTVTIFDLKDDTAQYFATSVKRPTGETLTLSYTRASVFVAPPSPRPGGTQQVNLLRLNSVESNNGYRLTYKYSSSVIAMEWLTKIGVSVENVKRGTGILAGSSYSQPSISGARTLSISDMAGRSTAYSIDSSGRITSITYPGSSSADVSFAYDAGGRVSSVTDRGGPSSYTYSDSGNIRTTKVTDPNSRVSSFTFNISTLKMLSSTNPVGQSSSFQYDSYGRATRLTSPEGNATQYTYDARGNVTETRVIAKAGSGISDAVTSAAFPCSSAATCDKPQWTRDARGNQTDYSYDSASGNITSIILPADAAGIRATTAFGYATVNGAQRGIRAATCVNASSCAGSPSERVVDLSYDVNGLPATVTTRAGDSSVSSGTTTSYDAYGNVSSIDGPLPGTDDAVYYRYDSARQLIGQVLQDPDGAGALKRRAVRTTYDARGRSTLVEQGTVPDASDSGWNGFAPLRQVAQTFDGSGRVVRQTMSAGGSDYAITGYGYDAVGQRICTAVRMDVSQWSGQTDYCTPQTTGSNGADRVQRLGYDAAGRVTTVINAFGTAEATTEQQSYTPNGRIASVADGVGHVTSYTYDGFDRLQRTSYPGGSYEEQAYDASGNIVSRRLRDGQTLSYNYDALDRRTYDDNPNTNVAEVDASYSYDNFGNTTRAQDQNGWYAAFEYDALGRATRQYSNLSSNSLQYDVAGRMTRQTWADGFYVTYEYNNANAVTAIRENGGTVLASFSYDDFGRRTSLSRANGTVTTYGYDAASRLTSLGLDLAGTSQDLTLTFGYNPAGQIAGRSSSNDSYAYSGGYNVDRSYGVNALNQLASAGGTALGYDGRGNLTSSGSTTYGYNTRNQLYTNGAGQLFYRNPAGLLNHIIANGAVTNLDYVGLSLATEFDGNSGAVLRRYISAPGIDEPLVWYEGAGTSDRRFIHADERGSVVAVTNASGAALAINTYDEFGIPGTGNLGRFQYTGQKWISELGMYDYKARMYSPTLGRFMQTDPIGYSAGLNWYNYVGSDPVNKTDPLGLYCEGTRVDANANPADCKQAGGVYTPDITVNGRRYVSSAFGTGVGIRVSIGNGPAVFIPNVQDQDIIILASPPKKDDPCNGSVRAEGISLTGILGLGITASVGKVTVNRSGASSWFFSVGVGAGLDAGFAGFATRYNSLSSFKGCAESYNGSVPLLGRSVGYSRSYDVDGNHTGDTLNGSGFPGLPGIRAGLSGTATDTSLVGGQCAR